MQLHITCTTSKKWRMWKFCNRRIVVYWHGVITPAARFLPTLEPSCVVSQHRHLALVFLLLLLLLLFPFFPLFFFQVLHTHFNTCQICSSRKCSTALHRKWQQQSCKWMISDEKSCPEEVVSPKKMWQNQVFIQLWLNYHCGSFQSNNSRRCRKWVHSENLKGL